MAKKKTAKTKKRKTPRKPISLALTKQQKIIFGSFLFLFGIALFFSFISFYYSWQADQSNLETAALRDQTHENLLNAFGNTVGDFFIYQGFGIAAFIIAVLITISGIYLFFDYAKKQLQKFWFWGLLVMIWFSIFFGFFTNTNTILSGVIGYEMNDFLQDYIGLLGTILVMAFLAIVYLVLRLKLTPEKIALAFQRTKNEVKADFDDDEIDKTIDRTDYEKEVVETVAKPTHTTPLEEPVLKTVVQDEINTPTPHSTEEGDVAMEIEQVEEEESVEENLSKKLVEDFGKFDPTLELSNYKFPTLDLLVETLNNYKIGIANIKATVGPTVTLYEIIPEAGIRISKIKNLEDDIALSLSALGIRIIAPIPGRGTIGIEVPNQNPRIVSMRSAIASPKFQNAEMELPLTLGKTISNETFVVDLAKMPHLLMAGATGQGKSVGLNAILTSLLYKKHPAEVKFVLVDPKKVELTLFNKIERHYLAKLPDTDEAIITDTNKVINTLNSLCIEMDARYDLLKDAMCRNIKEYNTKFKNRKLNPNDGHHFLPYIVLVIDEFADLIMTAGKEVETPIARLAQLARAIGIHLIVATQRPSVNVITGIIKANFPARIAFRVTSKIDSRTILDNSGADQLIGRGDMLYTQGNDLTRIQCAFVDTPEVADITDFIGAQKAYPEAHQLPEYVSEEGGTTLDISQDERDKLFGEAAEVLVIAQQGSASLLQRKLKLGYNRAGRIIDQLEAAGIVGPFEGSKARQVLIPTLEALKQHLDNE
jgi:DNA segregation ATPase FtsK/SpoIIIE, S-DNA-T family